MDDTLVRAQQAEQGGSRHWLSQRFGDQELEVAFLDSRRNESLPHVRRLLTVMAALGLGGAIVALVDPLFSWATAYGPGVEELQRRMVQVDLGWVLGASLVLLWATRAELVQRQLPFWLGVYLVLFVPVGSYTVARAPQEVITFGSQLALVHLFLIHVIARLRFVHATITSLTATVVFAVAALSYVPYLATVLPLQLFMLLIANAFGMFGSYALEHHARNSFLRAYLLDREREKSDRLLRSILPASVAVRLKAGEEDIADGFSEVSLLFADIVGFTPLSERLSPEQLVRLLKELFTAFDELAERHGVEKIKTIGDAYMAVAGVPEPCLHHAEAVAELAFDMLEATRCKAEELGEKLQLRIGLHSGPVVAGVIGKKRFIYDLWGDAVNVAARMEAHGVPGKIQISSATRQRLLHRYRTTSRGMIEVKGKGLMDTFLLEGRVEDNEVPDV